MESSTSDTAESSSKLASHHSSSSSSFIMDEDDSAVHPKPRLAPSLRDSRSWSIPDWLAAREDAGLHRHPALRCRNSRVDPSKLSSVVAWNPSRMRNMILSIGPGTPASALWKSGADREEHDDEMDFENDDDSSDSDQVEILATADEVLLHALEQAEHRHEEEDGDDDDDDENSQNSEAAAAGGGRDDDVMQVSSGDQPNDDNGDDDEAEGNDPDQVRLPRNAEEFVRNFIRAHGEAFLGQEHHEHRESEDDSDDEEDDDDSDSSSVGPIGFRNIRASTVGWNRSSQNQPSMRHGGCINTACWMECPWQLSTNEGVSSSSSIPVTSYECPTQLITSGDDKLVKLWDVKDAMGIANPLEGGWDTFTPLSKAPRPNAEAAKKSWKGYYRNKPTPRMAGGARHLATLVTGHRGNVFHATPVNDQPGKILTCAADGSLRLSDLQSEVSSVVAYLGDRSHFLFHSAMAFSHVFLTSNTGLVCSEEGLHRFDLRLPPREQQRRSVLDGVEDCFASDYCKSCAVWSPHMQGCSTASDGGVESSYVFAGGRSELVALLDLRAAGQTSRIVETYKPRGLVNTRNVSVSGIDVSKDGRELLVSYESDQIYSFPVLQDCFSSAGPTLEEIDSRAEAPHAPAPELASYGGHLNRFTFLKNAKYAGPNDDYICTGSDSGCGWIYERKTGAAVSLLGGDKCTCNGLTPHPSLPFFISYGIDSTAKLWRATPPVHRTADDSPSGRALCSLEKNYEMSPIVRSWSTTQRLVERDASPGMLPDFVASPRELASSYRFSPRERSSICGTSSTIFGNALRLLPSILRRNRHECYRGFQRSLDSHRGVDTPVEQPVEDFSHRVSISRLRFQADYLGLTWNPKAPWAFEASLDAGSATGDPPRVDPADLVPDSPSDWLLLDGNMTGIPYEHKHLNEEDYGDILRTTFPDDKSFFSLLENDDDDNEEESSSSSSLPPWLRDFELPDEEEVESNQWLCCNHHHHHCKADVFAFKSRQMFLATLHLLKEGGNKAMKEGDPFPAARRYDKAIQYCAVALMKHEQSKDRLKHLAYQNPLQFVKASSSSSSSDDDDADDDDMKKMKSAPVWSSLMQVLVTTHLNMALLLLRPEFADPTRAVDQARSALEYLRAFTTVNEDGVNVKQQQQQQQQLLPLQAKANFRLGSAKLELGNYSEAIKYFEESLKDSRKTGGGSSSSHNKKGGTKKSDDALVIRRLHEAKRKLKTKKKRDRKKFERACRPPAVTTASSSSRHRPAAADGGDNNDDSSSSDK